MAMTSFVHLAAHVEGLHHWPDAGDPDRYLALPHRHLFQVTCDVQVFDDREIEVNAAARWLTALLPTLTDTPTLAGRPVDYGTQSCHDLAGRITEVITRRYGRTRRVRTTVLHDGRLGAGISWEPDPLTAAWEPGS